MTLSMTPFGPANPPLHTAFSHLLFAPSSSHPPLRASWSCGTGRDCAYRREQRRLSCFTSCCALLLRGRPSPPAGAAAVVPAGAEAWSQGSVERPPKSGGTSSMATYLRSSFMKAGSPALKSCTRATSRAGKKRFEEPQNCAAIQGTLQTSIVSTLSGNGCSFCGSPPICRSPSSSMRLMAAMVSPLTSRTTTRPMSEMPAARDSA
mmetsp:Transcript_44768/g.104575  ORF Transcript_44768/g.104575 Transcript_44768/m.104575 type:complete len:206 (+) Transcript_44768:101-718(+)